MGFLYISPGVNLNSPNTWTAVQSFAAAIGEVGGQTTHGLFGVGTVIGEASEVLVTGTTAQTVLTTNAGTAPAGDYLIMGYFRVVTATTTVTLSIYWQDVTGTQSSTPVNAVAEAVGSYTIVPHFVNQAAGGTQSPEVQITAGTANQVYFSGVILALG